MAAVVTCWLNFGIPPPGGGLQDLPLMDIHTTLKYGNYTFCRSLGTGKSVDLNMATPLASRVPLGMSSTGCGIGVQFLLFFLFLWASSYERFSNLTLSSVLWPSSIPRRSFMLALKDFAVFRPLTAEPGVNLASSWSLSLRFVSARPTTRRLPGNSSFDVPNSKDPASL